MVHVPPLATVVQLFVCEKSLAFVPAKDTPETVSATAELFVTVTACGALFTPIA
jgi:hypothetical protein